MSGIILTDSLPVSTTNPLPIRAPSALSIAGTISGMPAPGTLVVPVRHTPLSTFAVTTQATALTNASLLSLALTGAGAPALRLVGIFIVNVQTTAIVGVNVQFELRRFLTHSAGTGLTPISYDTQNVIHPGVSARTNATITGEVTTPLRTWFMNMDDISAGSASNQGISSALMQISPALSPLQQAPTIRTGEGLHIKCISISSTGLVNVSFVFTQE